MIFSVAEPWIRRTFGTWLVPLFLLLLGCPIQARAAAPVLVDPAHTWVFAVGVLDFQDKGLSPFSKKHRKDAELIEKLKNLGVPSDHIVYLQDAQCTLANINSQFPQLLEKSTADDELVFYYCGHGFKSNDGGFSYFANYDSGKKSWAVSSIIDAIEKHFHGARALLCADCCTSGALFNAAKERGRKVSYGVLTSSASNEGSTGNWTFTQSVLSGLNGDPSIDLNRDGKITFAELGEYIKDEMAVFESQMATAGVTEDFDEDTVVANVNGGLPLAERVEVMTGGKWWKAKLLERKDDQGKVHWIQIGYDSSDQDEWVDLKNIRPINVTTTYKYPLEKECLVLWEGKNYRATIIGTNRGLYLVHYDGYGNSWDEWVDQSRISER